PARDHAGTRGDAHSGLYGDLPFGAEEHIHTRAEFDQADPFASVHAVPRLLVEDGAARDQSSDLFEAHGSSLPLHGDDVLLVLVGADFPAGDVELTFLVVDFGDGPGDGRTV